MQTISAKGCNIFELDYLVRQKMLTFRNKLRKYSYGDMFRHSVSVSTHSKTAAASARSNDDNSYSSGHA